MPELLHSRASSGCVRRTVSARTSPAVGLRLDLACAIRQELWSPGLSLLRYLISKASSQWSTTKARQPGFSKYLLSSRTTSPGIWASPCSLSLPPGTGRDRRQLSSPGGVGVGGDAEGRKEEALDSGFRIRVCTSPDGPVTDSSAEVSQSFTKLRSC